MNGSTYKIAAVALAAIAAIVIFGSAFIVQQTQYALVLRFGELRGQPISTPGLHFKVPLIDTVQTFDKRVIDLDRPAQEVIAADQKRIVIDTFSRYKIVNPLLFFQSVGTIAGANVRLSSIVDSTVRGVLADATFTAIVRTDRAGYSDKIRDEVNAQAKGFGIQIVDVRIRRADLPEQNSQAVFQRMQTERQREAADIRAQGGEQSQGIRARADREKARIIGDATQKSEETRGQADAERNGIFAEAFGRDPDFFAFYRSMQAYEAGFKPGDTRMIVSPDSDFFRYFGNAKGARPVAPPPAPAAPPRN